MLKQQIFNSKQDYLRWLFSITHFQSSISFSEVAETVKKFSNDFRQHRVLTSNSEVREIINKRTVKLVAFTLMPNHFHLLLKEIKEGGIATYMQRLQNSFTKYSNIKNETSGHLFQGPYRLVHIADNDQLLYTSAYIHRNCRELKGWKGKEIGYPWSSYQDFAGLNRWGKLICLETILEQFDSFQEYKDFIDESGAKEDIFESIAKIEN